MAEESFELVDCEDSKNYVYKKAKGFRSKYWEIFLQRSEVGSGKLDTRKVCPAFFQSAQRERDLDGLFPVLTVVLEKQVWCTICKTPLFWFGPGTGNLRIHILSAKHVRAAAAMSRDSAVESADCEIITSEKSTAAESSESGILGDYLSKARQDRRASCRERV